MSPDSPESVLRRRKQARKLRRLRYTRCVIETAALSILSTQDLPVNIGALKRLIDDRSRVDTYFSSAYYVAELPNSHCWPDEGGHRGNKKG